MTRERETTESLKQYRWSPDPDLNSVSPDYEVGVSVAIRNVCCSVGSLQGIGDTYGPIFLFAVDTGSCPDRTKNFLNTDVF